MFRSSRHIPYPHRVCASLNSAASLLAFGSVLPLLTLTCFTHGSRARRAEPSPLHPHVLCDSQRIPLMRRKVLYHHQAAQSETNRIDKTRSSRVFVIVGEGSSYQWLTQLLMITEISV